MTPPIPSQSEALVTFYLGMLALLTVFASLAAAILYIVQQAKLI